MWNLKIKMKNTIENRLQSCNTFRSTFEHDEKNMMGKMQISSGASFFLNNNKMLKKNRKQKKCLSCKTFALLVR